MANRATPATQQETLAPPWQLSAFDTNWNSPITALNDSSLGYVNGSPLDTGSANAYAVTLPFGSPSAYQDGMTVPFIPANTNTGASTITVSPLGAAAILNPAGIALQGGELPANKETLLIYKSASPVGFRIVGPCALSINLTGQSGNISIECAGYTSIIVNSTWTSGTGLVTTLAHLAQGVPVILSLVNGTGANTTFAVAPTNPAGTAFTAVTGINAGTGTGAVGQNILSAFTINSGRQLILTGGAISALTAVFSL